MPDHQALPGALVDAAACHFGCVMWQHERGAHRRIGRVPGRGNQLCINSKNTGALPFRHMRSCRVHATHMGLRRNPRRSRAHVVVAVEMTAVATSRNSKQPLHCWMRVMRIWRHRWKCARRSDLECGWAVVKTLARHCRKGKNRSTSTAFEECHRGYARDQRLAPCVNGGVTIRCF
jgi:hypothetical protein